jgi:hypothetical protein
MLQRRTTTDHLVQRATNNTIILHTLPSAGNFRNVLLCKSQNNSRQLSYTEAGAAGRLMPPTPPQSLRPKYFFSLGIAFLVTEFNNDK